MNSQSIGDIENMEADRIPSEKLEKLADSSELKAMLCNKHLQRLLLEVNKAKDKAGMIEGLMQEPIFVEFADQCLATVAPDSEEKSRQDGTT